MGLARLSLSTLLLAAFWCHTALAITGAGAASTPVAVPATATAAASAATPNIDPAANSAKDEQREARYSDLLEKANHVLEDAHRIIDLMVVFIGVLGLVLTVALAGLTFLGLSERKRIREATDGLETSISTAQSKSEEARSAMERAAAQADASSKEYVAYVQGLRTAVEKAWGDIDSAFEQLPAQHARWALHGGRRPQVDPAVDATFTDADTLLLVCDRLGIIADRNRSAEHLLKVAKYWRFKADYHRAEQRLRRAIERAPQNQKAHVDLARTFAYSAEGSPQRLESALGELKTAQGLGPPTGELLWLRGWVLDELARYDEAVEEYRASLPLTVDEEKPFTTYNIACSLVHLGRVERAFAELESLEPNRAIADGLEVDGDFALMREVPAWSGRFKSLVARLRGA